MNAQIMDMKRFAIHDGDGIRTTIFFKGCPLRCVWCHNPEGLWGQTQLSYIAAKCMNCGNCAVERGKVTASEGSGSTAVGKSERKAAMVDCTANYMQDGNHIFDRTKCKLCGRCETVCPSGCFQIYGKTYNVEELAELVMEDKDFYDCSGGGVTLSGGECLLQADFCAMLLKVCKEKGIHTAVDTCGFVPGEAIEKVMPFTDIFLYDLKAVDEEVHIRCTGQSNRLILDNLAYLSEAGKEIEIRIPLVPGYNSDQVDKMGQFLTSLPALKGVRVLAYHNLSESKYASLGMECHMPACTPPSKEMMEEAERKLRSYGLTVM